MYFNCSTLLYKYSSLAINYKEIVFKGYIKKVEFDFHYSLCSTLDNNTHFQRLVL